MYCDRQVVISFHSQPRLEHGGLKSCLPANVGAEDCLKRRKYLSQSDTPELVASLDMFQHPNHHTLRSVVPGKIPREGLQNTIEAIFEHAGVQARAK